MSQKESARNLNSLSEPGSPLVAWPAPPLEGPFLVGEIAGSLGLHVPDDRGQIIAVPRILPRIQNLADGAASNHLLEELLWPVEVFLVQKGLLVRGTLLHVALDLAHVDEPDGTAVEEGAVRENPTRAIPHHAHAIVVQLSTVRNEREEAALELRVLA